MKKMDYQNVKGTQDYLPDAEMIRGKIRRILEDTFQRYGCKPLETPILNYRWLTSNRRNTIYSAYEINQLARSESRIEY